MQQLLADVTFEEAMNIYADMVTRICFMRLRNEQDTKDVFQTVFLRLYETKKQFTSQNQLKAWLIQTSMHACIDESRKFWRKHSVQLDDMLFATETKEDMELSSFLLRLPLSQRNTLYLYYYEGYSIKEIAVLMKTNENTVKSWMLRGKKNLRKYLGDEWYE